MFVSAMFPVRVLSRSVYAPSEPHGSESPSVPYCAVCRAVAEERNARIAASGAATVGASRSTLK